MLQRWRTVGNAVFDLTGPRFELQTSRSGDERVTARPIGRLKLKISEGWNKAASTALVVIKHHLAQLDLFNIYKTVGIIQNKHDCCSSLIVNKIKHMIRVIGTKFESSQVIYINVTRVESESFPKNTKINFEYHSSHQKL